MGPYRTRLWLANKILEHSTTRDLQMPYCPFVLRQVLRHLPCMVNSENWINGWVVEVVGIMA